MKIKLKSIKSNKLIVPSLIYGFPTTGKTTFMKLALEKGINVIDSDDICMTVLNSHRADAYNDASDVDRDTIDYLMKVAIKEGWTVVTNLTHRTSLYQYANHVSTPIHYFLPVSAGEAFARFEKRNPGYIDKDTITQWYQGSAEWALKFGLTPVFLHEDEYITDCFEI